MDLYLEQILAANKEAKAQLQETNKEYDILQKEYDSYLRKVEEGYEKNLSQQAQSIKENYEQKIKVLHDEIETKTNEKIKLLKASFEKETQSKIDELVKVIIAHE